MDDRTQKLMDKVARLRALAANSKTPAEAEAAAARAAAIIAKYQIDVADIEAADPTRAEIVGESESLWEGGRSDNWRASLACGLAKIHGCACIVDYSAKDAAGGDIVRYRIAGRPADVAIVRYLFAWLTAEITRLAAREHGRAAMNAFRVGAMAGVLKAMREARQAETAVAASTSTAMVLVKRSDESLSYLKGVMGGRFTKFSGRITDRGARDRGFAAGSNLQPRAGLGAGGGRLMLGPGRR